MRSQATSTIMTLFLALSRTRTATAWLPRVLQHRPTTIHSVLFQPSRLFAAPPTNLDQDLTDLQRRVQQALDLSQQNIDSTTDIAILQRQLNDLEHEQSQPGFWDNPDANILQQVSDTTRLVARLTNWHQWRDDCQAALEILLDESDNCNDDTERDFLCHELSSTTQLLLDDSQRYQLELLLSGPYDASPARLVLTAGAGGTEANDWVSDLKRMYERHCAQRGFTCVLEDAQDGDVTGYKSVELLITGQNAYGWLAGEKGAHRLVRLSPFNANNKRQTTFAGVDVAPADVMDSALLQEVDLPESELEITTMRAGGKGGQNVNKVNSAVRIKHLPSGLQVKCTQERSQSLNREIALKRLKAQLLAVAQEQRVKEIQEIRGDMVEASWGAQIRNYVLHPYKMIKDQRTGWESSDTQAFLDGDLEDCIGAYLRYKAEQAAAEQSS